MKPLLRRAQEILLALLLPSTLLAQTAPTAVTGRSNIFSAKADKALSLGLTLSGKWAPPQLAADPASCAAADEGYMWENLSSHVYKGCLNGVVTSVGSGGGGGAFSDLTSGTNTTAAMVVGTGGSLAASGSGTIVATGVVAGTGSVTFAGPSSARIITVPDAAFTAARTDAANTFTGHQTIEGVTSTGATGTGKFVFDGSPTIVTPTIASFTNATHNHQNAAGGGSLDAAAIGSGTLSASRGGSGASNGILKADGSGNVSAATAGTDYALPPTANAQTGATYTTVSTDCGKTVTNTGNAGSLAITLINDPTVGCTVAACVTAAQSVSVAPNTGETMYFNGSTASSVSCASIGCCVTYRAVTGGSGALWFDMSRSGPVS